LSYYDFDDLKKFYPEDRFAWHRQSVYRSAATRSSAAADYNGRSKGTEILIMNYPPTTVKPAAKVSQLAPVLEFQD
jgi:hypothetical protein